jgi:hypothetical protein
MKIKIPQLLWYENSEGVRVQPSWSIFFWPMRGEEKETGKASLKLIGSKPIQELAKGEKEIATLFDDMARPKSVSEKELGIRGVGGDFKEERDGHFEKRIIKGFRWSDCECFDRVCHRS